MKPELFDTDIELDKAQELRCTKEYMSNDFQPLFKKGVVYKYNGAYCIIDENGCNRPLSADDIRGHFERVVDGQKFKVGDKIISVYGFKGTVIGFDENEKQYHYKDDNGIEHLLHIDNQKHWDLQEPSDVELDRAARLFLLHNGSIIHNLHREDAINSFIKDAFKAGSKWKEEKLLENAVEGSITNACNIVSIPVDELDDEEIKKLAQGYEDNFDVGEQGGYLNTHRGDLKDAVIYGAMLERERNRQQHKEDVNKISKLAADTAVKGIIDMCVDCEIVDKDDTHTIIAVKNEDMTDAEIGSRLKMMLLKQKEENKQGVSKPDVAKCGECPFYHEDKDNVNNSYCRFNNGWGWGMSPTDTCTFNKTLVMLKRLFQKTEITW